MNISASLRILGAMAVNLLSLVASEHPLGVRTYSGMAGTKRAEMLLAWDFPTDGNPDSKPYFHVNL